MTGRALVTGASGGIGLEITRLLAADGYDLFLVARDGGKLEMLCAELGSSCDVKAEYLALDLSDPSAADELVKTCPDVDVLVNNAGFGDYGPFSECDWSKQERMINLNDLTLAKLTRTYLPGMISKKSGRILNVASVAAFQPGPLMSVYYASKAFVLSFTESLAEELRGTGVTVTALCPGPVNTGFSAAANAGDVSLFKESSGADAKAVAAYGYRSMMKGKVVAVHGLLFKAGLFFERILPRCAVRRILHGIQGKRTGGSP